MVLLLVSKLYSSRKLTSHLNQTAAAQRPLSSNVSSQMTRYKKYLLIIETLVVFLPFVWLWVFFVLLSIKQLAPSTLVIVIPPMMGLVGLVFLLRAVLLERVLNYPYLTFFLVGAGVVPFLAILFTSGKGVFHSIEAFLSYSAFLLPILVVMHLSYIYFSSANKSLKSDAASGAA